MKVLDIDGIEVFSSVYEYLDSNMYVLFPCEREAVIIDPHVDQECLSLLDDRGILKLYILLTHEHTDHTSGIFWYQEKFHSVLICQKECADYISNSRSMRPLLTYLILAEKDYINGSCLLEKFKKEYIIRTYKADISFDAQYDFELSNYCFHFVHIPGHSKGSTLILVNNMFAFTGDSFMKENPVITRFPGSNHNQFIEYTLPILSTLDPEMRILPGHGEPFCYKEMIVDGKLNIEYK